MEPAEILFTSVLWKTKTRMWSCSRNFSKIMKPEIEKCEDWECLEVWKCDKSENEESVLIWSNRKENSSLLKLGKSLVDSKDESKKGVETES
jgi:hypothetical protein